jgi:hypothetical protein
LLSVLLTSIIWIAIPPLKVRARARHHAPHPVRAQSGLSRRVIRLQPWWLTEASAWQRRWREPLANGSIHPAAELSAGIA